MCSAPRFLQSLRLGGYHAWADRHVGVLAKDVVEAFASAAPDASAAAESGELVYDLRRRLGASSVDLVLGHPVCSPSARPSPLAVQRGPVETIEVAIQMYAAMEHHLAVLRLALERLGRFESDVRMESSHAATGAVFVLNVSPRFRSPLRCDVCEDPQISATLAEVLAQINARRASVDALCILGIDFDNLGSPPREAALSSYNRGGHAEMTAFAAELSTAWTAARMGLR